MCTNILFILASKEIGLDLTVSILLQFAILSIDIILWPLEDTFNPEEVA